MKISVIGGAGYVGSSLVPHLLKKGHQLTVLDTFWYGDFLPKSTSLHRIVGDIRERKDLIRAIEGQDAVIHLACVSNDPSFDMNPNLGREVNYDAFKELLSVVSQENIPRFVYASSSSVYGVSDAPEVFEETPKKPLTDYSKYKLACEEWLKGFGSGGCWTILRPATVCGYSPRMRLDVVVNKLTIDAIKRKSIVLFGKTQMRPNIHIEDMVRAYDFILEKDYKYVNQKIFNVGFENMSLRKIASTIKGALKDPNIEVVEQPSNDPRSYHINSDKIKAAGFEPKRNVGQAILSIEKNLDRLHEPLGNKLYYNILRMRELKLA